MKHPLAAALAIALTGALSVPAAAQTATGDTAAATPAADAQQ